MYKGISIRAPWWWFIFHGGKTIENRSRMTTYRGRLLVQASTWWNEAEIIDDAYFAGRMMHAAGVPRPAERITIDSLKPFGGQIVGCVDVVDCVTTSNSPFFVGPVGLVLTNPVRFAEPIPCKGAVMVPFPITAEVADLGAIERQINAATLGN